jgi:hypothetical protein
VKRPITTTEGPEHDIHRATHIAVRVAGLALYGRVAWDDVAKRAAVRRFALRSVGGLAAVAIVAGAALTGAGRTTQTVTVGILAVG